MKKLFTLFLALAASVGTMVAQKVQIGDLYYYLDASNLTAEVICQLHGSKNNYSGLTTATIPATITYNAQEYSVTSIGGLAFYKCSSLTSVEIPNSVTSIEYAAFEGCSGLKSIEIPNSVTSIGVSAFRDCSGLTSVTIGNSVTSIGVSAFYSCTGLTSVTIGNSVTSIEFGAFANCTGMTEIVVSTENPNYCSADGVLFDKDQTTLIQYPGGKQGEYTIPNSVKAIGGYAFAGCTSLTSVTITNSVTSIRDHAFDGCNLLSSIICEALLPPIISSNTFSNKSCILFVPEESIMIYQNAVFWEEFDDIRAIGSKFEVSFVDWDDTVLKI